MSPKEIAENTLNNLYYAFNENDTKSLACAYLELEKARAVCPNCGEEVSTDQKIRMAHDIRIYESEISKLKADNEYLLRQYADEVSGICDDKRFKKLIELESEITKLKEEKESVRFELVKQLKYNTKIVLESIDKIEQIKKLKKSREVLRKAVGFYKDIKPFPDDGKKAREALKADDEIMEGK